MPYFNTKKLEGIECVMPADRMQLADGRFVKRGHVAVNLGHQVYVMDEKLFNLLFDEQKPKRRVTVKEIEEADNGDNES